MISFDSFTANSDSPIYLQIIKYIKSGIASGTIADGDELPSRRFLSALLGVNPNTVQKAFHLLEEEGLIESRSGAKSFVTLSQGVSEKIKDEITVTESLNIIRAVKKAGLSKEQALRLLDELWDKE